jgi:S-adenosylmethionine:tRNA ribosyltransferase-isomerase
VIQARLEFYKTTGARIEVFCLEPLTPHDYQLSLSSTTGCTWKCMVGNAKKWHDEPVTLTINRSSSAITLRAYKEAQMGNTFAVRFEWDGDNISFAEILDAAGELPIPPYLNRKTETSDLKTYQTVYSRIKGSVAAPTAGLHFTESVLADLHRRGIETDELTLHVGAGTFLPVKTADANEHTMHTEIIAVPRETIAHILAKLGSIVAVGTTSMRTLESLYFIGCQLRNAEMSEYRNIDSIHVDQFEPYENDSQHSALSSRLSTAEALQSILDYLDATHQQTLHAETQIMIKPGYTFHVVDQLITNFHQPQSTLLLLVSAFVGGDWHTIYDYALSHDFRFLSYGDSSILTRKL